VARSVTIGSPSRRCVPGSRVGTRTDGRAVCDLLSLRVQPRTGSDSPDGPAASVDLTRRRTWERSEGGQLLQFGGVLAGVLERLAGDDALVDLVGTVDDAERPDALVEVRQREVPGDAGAATALDG